MLVSILIPCYNAGPWLEQAIASALAQTWSHKEIIVVDDGSTDESLDIIRSFGDRVRWEAGPNRGGNPTRNRLLDLARGEWLQYLDADDYLLPDKITNQMEFLGPRPEVDVVYSPVTLEHWSQSQSRRELLPIPEPHDPWVLLARWYLPQTGSPLWRKQAIVDVGGWRADQPCCQEHELYLRLLMANKRFAFCGTSGAVYRQWGEHTVCKKDKPEVHRRRLEIEQIAEHFLRQRNELTAARLRAINQARFETARSVWQYDPHFATAIMKVVNCSEPGFIPGGAAGRGSYRAIYRLLGFRLAERIADRMRRWYRPCSRRERPDSNLIAQTDNRDSFLENVCEHAHVRSRLDTLRGK